MAECKKIKGMFEKALYNELQPHHETQFNLHLNNCEKCKNEYSELADTLKLFTTRKREEADPAFMENIWDNLEPELETKKDINYWIEHSLNKIKKIVTLEPTWSKQLAGGLALLIIGVFIGRGMMDNNQHIPSITTEVNNKHVTNVAIQEKADRYLNRSKVLLLGLMNYDPASEDIESISLPRQKKISRELITEAAVLKNELSAPSQRRLKALVSDLEVVLLQIANLESEFDISGIDMVKSGVDKRGIFLKINLQKMQQSNSLNEDVSEEKIEKNI